MTNSFDLTVLTKPFTDAAADRKKRVDRASMWALREVGRLAKREARKGAPVYQGDGAVKVSAVKRARKAGTNLAGAALGKGEDVAGGAVVAGLLRDSIGSSRRLVNTGGTYTNKVGPRGPRVHLYAGKIEATAGFMRHAHEVASAQMGAIHAKAWAKAMEQ